MKKARRIRERSVAHSKETNANETKSQNTDHRLCGNRSNSHVNESLTKTRHWLHLISGVVGGAVVVQVKLIRMMTKWNFSPLSAGPTACRWLCGGGQGRPKITNSKIKFCILKPVKEKEREVTNQWKRTARSKVIVSNTKVICTLVPFSWFQLLTTTECVFGGKWE